MTLDNSIAISGPRFPPLYNRVEILDDLLGHFPTQLSRILEYDSGSSGKDKVCDRIKLYG